MRQIPEIAIIGPNTLCGIGLKLLLERIIPMATLRIFRSFSEFTDDTPDMYAHYFITAQIYLEHSTFFAERRKKTIVLGTDSNPIQLTGVRILNIYQPEERLIKDLLKLYSSAHHSAHVPEKTAAQVPQPELSAREIEVLVLVTKGFINKEIADRLHISLSTVITHRKNITEKLGIKSVSGLTIYAVMNGYVEADQI